MNQLNDEHYRAHCAQLASLERAYQDLSRKIEALRRWAKPADDYRLDGYYQAQCQVRDIIDPPKPKWREKVDEWALVVSAVQKVDEWALVVSADPTLADVLGLLSGIARSGPSVSERATGDRLAQIVAICEQEVGDGWRANPDRVPVGHWGISWLLVTLSHEPQAWRVLGDRAAAWLRSLTDGGAA